MRNLKNLWKKNEKKIASKLKSQIPPKDLNHSVIGTIALVNDGPQSPPGRAGVVAYETSNQILGISG